MKKVITRLKSDSYNRIVFREHKNALLVGGFIRDAVMEKKSLDRDFIVEGNLIEIAEKLSHIFGGTVVTFKDGSMVRLALTNGITLDFSIIKKGIDEDLRSRDFTLNSLAFNPQEGIIDSCGAAEDIDRRIIRTYHERNILDDPLRCLRAYRFMAETGWNIDSDTREIIKKNRNKLKQISNERITLEFFKLLNAKNYCKALNMSLNDTLLEVIIPLTFNELRININNLCKIDRFIKKLPSKVVTSFKKSFSHNLTLIGMIRLEQILFHCNVKTLNFSFSRKIARRLSKAHAFLTQSRKYGTDTDIFDSFYLTKDMIYDFVCLLRREALIKKAEKFLYMERKKLLDSYEIMQLSTSKGSRLGALIYALERERFLGGVKNKKQARKFIASNIHAQN